MKLDGALAYWSWPKKRLKSSSRSGNNSSDCLALQLASDWIIFIRTALESCGAACESKSLFFRGWVSVRVLFRRRCRVVLSQCFSVARATFLRMERDREENQQGRAYLMLAKQLHFDDVAEFNSIGRRMSCGSGKCLRWMESKTLNMRGSIGGTKRSTSLFVLHPMHSTQLIVTHRWRDVMMELKWLSAEYHRVTIH